MTASARARRVVVMGIGNMLLKDDGVGVQAIFALQETSCPPEGVDVELVDAATSPDLSVYMDCGVDKLIIIDAVRAGGNPGAIYRFTPDVLGSEGKDIVAAHGLTLQESLALMRIAGTLPTEIVIIGVEPADMGWGATLSPEVAAKIGELIAAIQREIVS
jgi:hydrogenase maturation protease